MVAINQGGLSGLAGKFPASYMGAVVQGQGLGGIFASAINIIILSLGTSHVDAAFYDFLASFIFLTLALIAFITLTKSEFYEVSKKITLGSGSANRWRIRTQIDQLLT